MAEDTVFYLSNDPNKGIPLFIDGTLTNTSYSSAGKGITLQNLVKVEIGTKVRRIGNDAFQYCWKLKSVTISDSVTSIGTQAFSFCRALQNVTIGNSVTSIGNLAFAFCYDLQSVTMGDSVTIIGNNAFQSCWALKSVTIPDSVTSIGDSAFYNCKKLQSVTIGDSVTSIGVEAFSLCSALQSVTIPNRVTSIGSNAFYPAGITNVKMSRSTAFFFNLKPNIKQNFFGSTNIYIDCGNEFVQPGIISGDESGFDDWSSTDVKIALRYYKPTTRTFEQSREGLLIADLTKVEEIIRIYKEQFPGKNISIKQIKWSKKNSDGDYEENTYYEDERTYPYNGDIVKVECSYEFDDPAPGSTGTTVLSVKSNPTITNQTKIDTIVENLFVFETLDNLSNNFTNAEFRKTLTKVFFFKNITAISDQDTRFYDEGSNLYENMQEVDVGKQVTSITGTPFPPLTRYYIYSINKYLNPTTYSWVNETDKKLYFYLDEKSYQLAKTKDDDGIDFNVLRTPFVYDANNKKHEKCENVKYLYETSTKYNNNIIKSGDTWSVLPIGSQNTKGHIQIKTNIYGNNEYVGGITSAGGNQSTYYMIYTSQNQLDKDRTLKELTTTPSPISIDKSTLKFSPGVINPLVGDGIIKPEDNEYLRILDIVLKYGTTPTKGFTIGIASTSWGENQDKPFVNESGWSLIDDMTPEGGGICFPGNSKLILKDGTKKIFHEIEVGDEIQVCSKDMDLFYSKIIFLPHLQNNKSAEYIKFTTTSNQTIRATDLHLLPVLDKNNTLQNVIAKNITKEDKLYVLNNGKGVPEEIKTIETIEEKGVYTCLVKEGEYIVVDNIVASPFPGDGLDVSYVSKYAFSYTMLRLYANGFSMLDNIGVLKYIAPILRFIVLLVEKNCHF